MFCTHHRISENLFKISLLLAFIPRLILADDFFREGAPKLQLVSAQSTEPQGLPYSGFATLVKTLSPAVVNISVEMSGAEDGAEMPGSLPGQKPDKGLPFQSVGSGFVINEEGYLITCNHVIDRADKIIVRLLDDKSEYPAKVIGKDPKTDIALLKIEPRTKLTAAFVGDSDTTDVGDWVLAIGNQFQLGQTVTAGIISAKSRRVPSREAGPYDQFIQTDASINPGSSGGPLFNVHGQVIGINTAIFSPARSQFGGTGFNIGIGFAIPINLGKGIVRQLRESGKVTRGLLGVIIQPIGSDVAEAMGLKDLAGALVSDVVKDSPASSAGFQRGDVIVGYNGLSVREHDDLPLMVANTPIGAMVKVDLVRQGKKLTVEAKISELKDPAPQKEKEKPKANSLGMVVIELTSELKRALNAEDLKGVIVENVEPNSAAEKAGIVRGDVVMELAGQPVLTVEAFEKMVQSLTKGKPALVLIRKAEGTRFLTVKP